MLFMAKKILFQGDSITDVGRTQNGGPIGRGYPLLIASELGCEYPNEYEFINRGISGNRIVDLYARIKADFINLEPDYASIYIGVNDTWHEISGKNGVATEKFEKIYTMMIDEIYEACPNVKLIIIAPFVLEGPATCNTEEMPDKLERFRKDVAEKNSVAKKIAAKYNLPCIDLQPEFDKALLKADASYWTFDGVHPSYNGHYLIKKLWLEAFNKIK